MNPNPSEDLTKMKDRKHMSGNSGPLSSADILRKADVGLWALELDEGQAPRMVVDDVVLKLIGLTGQVSPEETYHAWYDHIDTGACGLVADCLRKMTTGQAEVQYPWHHPDGTTMMFRCCGVRNPEYTAGVRLEGTLQNVTAVAHFDEVEVGRLENADTQLKHERLRSEVLSYMIDHDDDPIELLKSFAERLRVLINCDQVIYRDLEETRIMVNSPAIEKTWSVPIEYCRQCEHFDAHHPMYAGGYTEMANCQEGWQGIPVYHDCPIKSSLTRLVFCDGEIAGYLAIHYVQDYHTFTDLERATLEEFTRILSISLSRYASRQKSSELESVKRTMNMIFSLSDEYDPIIVLEPKSGKYDWFMGKAAEIESLTAMAVHGKNLYEDVVKDADTIIHEEDRKQYKAFYTRENMLKIAETGESQEIENRWYILTEGQYRWKYNKAVRMIDENGAVHVVVGVVDTTEAKKKEAEYQAQKARLAAAEVEKTKSQKMLESFIENYTTVYTVNMADDSYKIIKCLDIIKQKYGHLSSFNQAMGQYVDDYVLDCDKPLLRREMEYGTIAGKLRTANRYTVEYRANSRKGIQFHEMVIAATGDEKQFLLAFVANDSTIISRKLHIKADMDYVALYEIDFDTGLIKALKKSSLYHHLEAGEAMAYTEAIRRFAAMLSGEPRAFFEQLSDLEHVKQQFAVENKHTYSYKSSFQPGKWVSVTSYVLLRHEDGTPAVFSMGFSYMDTLGADRQELQGKLQSALNAAIEEKKRTAIIHNIIHSGQWSFFVNAADEITRAEYSPDVVRVIDHDLSGGGYAWTEILHPDDKEEALAAFQATIADHSCQTPYDVTYRMVDRHGVYHWFHSAGRIIRDENGDGEFFGVHINITEQIEEQLKYQEQLQAALAMAQSANRAKTTFLNNMSHDIRTPMNAIIGFTGLAASHIDNKEQVQDYLMKIGQSSDHLLSLINDVLDMSRIESGKMTLEEKSEKISDIIHTLRDIVQADVRAKQLDFYIDAVEVNDENVICDKLRLNQVLLNVLSNAIKYTPAGGTVALRLREKTVKDSGYATYEFRIKDNGMGMSEEFLKTIFDPFTRVKSSTMSGIQGTGLGMAITKNIIDMMGGSIDIQSIPGKGTEVTMTFDFKLQDVPHAPVVIPELAGVRALVVDDDANACLSISGMIRDIGMRDEWCTSGKEAVIRAEQAFKRGDVFKVYIIDWLMPDMNGIETTRRIRKVIGGDTPIIILTAYDWSDVEDEAREAGVTAFISKPMFPSDLHRVLNSCLGKKQEAAAVEQRQGVEPDFAGKKILLVEDNELNREIATELLTEYGFVIATAEDGHIAVEKMREARDGDYDLVLMDVQMPTMNGYEATRAIRALGTPVSRIPILAMTANAFEEDRKLALEAGMNEHITKPIDIDKLKKTLARFL